eukprot:TRINITY_DN2325_c0_g1_i1.p1 TRINITY_DN2325_c0_g1~~TRINITY_DN2325_c0_g1_i1.p1  ORF type:complete len:310 (+),score=86.39 TRINITY_DN2325_c0_g1_i1:49-978(+)
MQGGWGDVGGAQPPRPIAPAPGALRAPAPIPPAQPQAQPQQTWPQAQPQQTWGQPQHQPQHQPQQQQQQQQQARSQAQSEYKHTPEELKQWEDYYRSLGQTWTPTPVQQQQAAANAAARSSAAQPPAAQPRAAHPPAATQTQPAANQPANGVGPESDDMKKLHKTIKFLVASQLSKFLSLPQYFDNNQEELLKCCRHIVPKVYDVEKKKDPEGYKSRKMQQGVLAYVNAYMEKYHRRKDEKVRDLRATRPGGARDRKRKRYGDIDLAGTPYVDADDLPDDSNESPLKAPKYTGATDVHVANGKEGEAAA